MRGSLLVLFVSVIAVCVGARAEDASPAVYLASNYDRTFDGELTLRDNFTYVLRWKVRKFAGLHLPPWRHEIELGRWKKEGVEIVFSDGWQEIAKRAGKDFCVLWGRYAIEGEKLSPIAGKAGTVSLAKKPNKAPEPTPTSVTSPAAQEPRQP